MSYKVCKVPGCDNLIKKGDYCLYHKSLIDRPCAYYYHKELAIPVEWCNRYNMRYIDLNCEHCPNWRDPEKELMWAAELAEKIGRIKE